MRLILLGSWIKVYLLLAWFTWIIKVVLKIAWAKNSMTFLFIVTEAIVIRESLRVADDYKIDNMMETDSQFVINSILGRIKPESEYNNVRDIFNLLDQ